MTRTTITTSATTLAASETSGRTRREQVRLEDRQQRGVCGEDCGDPDQACVPEPRFPALGGIQRLGERDRNRDAEHGVIRDDEERPDPVHARPVAVEAQEVEPSIVLVEERLHDRALLEDPVRHPQDNDPPCGEPAPPRRLPHEQGAAAIQADEPEQAERQLAERQRAEEDFPDERGEDEECRGRRERPAGSGDDRSAGRHRHIYR